MQIIICIVIGVVAFTAFTLLVVGQAIRITKLKDMCEKLCYMDEEGCKICGLRYGYGHHIDCEYSEAMGE